MKRVSVSFSSLLLITLNRKKYREKLCERITLLNILKKTNICKITKCDYQNELQFCFTGNFLSFILQLAGNEVCHYRIIKPINQQEYEHITT